MSWVNRVVAVVSTSSNRGEEDSRELAGAGHLGDACARDMASAGASVVAVDGDAKGLERLVGEIREAGGRISGVVADPCDPTELQQAAVQIEEAHGAVDALITCHSDLELESIERSTIDSWRRVVDFNLLGPVFAVKAFLPLLKRGTDPAIVHCGSIDGTLGNPQVPSYSAAKGGLVPLTHVMGEEFGQYGIRVNCLARAMTVQPGAELPPMFPQLVAHTPLGRPALPQEVAAAIRFLASTEASYVNGAVLPVDGGRSGITPGTRPNRTPPSVASA